MIRETALLPADAPLADRQSIGWAIFADTLFDRPEPTVLSAPCTECGKFEIVCDCVRADENLEPFDHDDYADADDFYTRRQLEKRNPDCLARYGEDIFGDGM